MKSQISIHAEGNSLACHGAPHEKVCLQSDIVNAKGKMQSAKLSFNPYEKTACIHTDTGGFPIYFADSLFREVRAANIKFCPKYFFSALSWEKKGAFGKRAAGSKEDGAIFAAACLR